MAFVLGHQRSYPREEYGSSCTDGCFSVCLTMLAPHSCDIRQQSVGDHNHCHLAQSFLQRRCDLHLLHELKPRGGGEQKARAIVAEVVNLGPCAFEGLARWLAVCTVCTTLRRSLPISMVFAIRCLAPTVPGALACRWCCWFRMFLDVEKFGAIAAGHASSAVGRIDGRRARQTSVRSSFMAGAVAWEVAREQSLSVCHGAAPRDA